MAILAQNVVRAQQPSDDKTTNPIADNTHVFKGALIAMNASGYAVPVPLISGTNGAGLVIFGVAPVEYVNNLSGHAAGTIVPPVFSQGVIASPVDIRSGIFLFTDIGGGADAITTATGQLCYASDDHTVNATDGNGTRPIAGRVREIDPVAGVWVEVSPVVTMGGRQILGLSYSFMGIDLTAAVNATVLGPVQLGNPALAGSSPLVPAGKLISIGYIPIILATGATKTITLTLGITANGGSLTSVTGGVLTLNTANVVTPGLGSVPPQVQLTGANTFNHGDTWSVTESSVTAFTAGSGLIVVGILPPS